MNNKDGEVSYLVRMWLAYINYSLTDASGPGTRPDWEAAFEIVDKIKELGYEP